LRDLRRSEAMPERLEEQHGGLQIWGGGCMRDDVDGRRGFGDGSGCGSSGGLLPRRCPVLLVRTVHAIQTQTPYPSCSQQIQQVRCPSRRPDFRLCSSARRKLSTILSALAFGCRRPRRHRRRACALYRPGLSHSLFDEAIFDVCEGLRDEEGLLCVVWEECARRSEQPASPSDLSPAAGQSSPARPSASPARPFLRVLASKRQPKILCQHLGGLDGIKHGISIRD
jgi:hypothetical protein